MSLGIEGLGDSGLNPNQPYEVMAANMGGIGSEYGSAALAGMSLGAVDDVASKAQAALDDSAARTIAAKRTIDSILSKMAALKKQHDAAPSSSARLNLEQTGNALQSMFNTSLQTLGEQRTRYERAKYAVVLSSLAGNLAKHGSSSEAEVVKQRAVQTLATPISTSFIDSIVQSARPLSGLGDYSQDGMPYGGGAPRALVSKRMELVGGAALPFSSEKGRPYAFPSQFLNRALDTASRIGADSRADQVAQSVNPIPSGAIEHMQRVRQTTRSMISAATGGTDALNGVLALDDDGLGGDLGAFEWLSDAVGAVGGVLAGAGKAVAGALPAVGGVVGTILGGPGLGTSLGGALGGAINNLVNGGPQAQPGQTQGSSLVPVNALQQIGQQTYQNVAPQVAPKAPFPWLIVGIGGVAVVGIGAFLLLRK